MRPLSTAESTRGPVATGPFVRGWPRVALVAITVAVLAETLRGSVPLLWTLAVDIGTAATSVIALLVALAGLAAPLLRTVAGPRAVLITGVGGLLVSRLLMQAISPHLWLALAGTALGMLALAGLYETARSSVAGRDVQEALSGGGFAVAVAAGLTFDTAVRLAFGTWDVMWRDGPAAWLVCVAVTGAGLAALVQQLRATPEVPSEVAWRDALGAVAFGPFFALQLLVLANPAFAASGGQVSLAMAGALVLTGQVLAIVALISGVAARSLPGGVCFLGGTILGVAMGAVTGPHGLTGPMVLVAIVTGQMLSAWLLAVACRASLVQIRQGGGTVLRVDLASAGAGLVLVLILLLYQLHYESPLPVPNMLLPGAAGMLLGLIAAGTAEREGPAHERSVPRLLVAGGLAIPLLCVPVTYGVNAPGVSRPAGSRGTFRLVSYNIHVAVNVDGTLDPEAIARNIEAERADVVLLQEVGRGWPLSATMDTGTWLARRLKMRMIYGPTADNQLGNAVLTRLPVRSSGSDRLPQGTGSMVRGYVWARLDVGGGLTADVWSTHLQNHDGQSATRLAEISKLLRAWSGAHRTVIGGDMNAGPGGPELGRLFAAGLRGAQDESRGPVTTVDNKRIDWIFATDDVGFSDLSVRRSNASDHYPVATTVRVVG